MCVCVSRCVCVSAYVCVRLCMCMYACICEFVSACSFVRLPVHVFICMHLNTQGLPFYLLTFQSLVHIKCPLTLTGLHLCYSKYNFINHPHLGTTSPSDCARHKKNTQWQIRTILFFPDKALRRPFIININWIVRKLCCREKRQINNR